MPIKLSRPRILARAAKAGAALYRRDRDLARIAPRLFARKGPKSVMLSGIAAAEAACEEERRSGSATYSIERHVSLLAALIAEAASGQSAAA